MGWLLGCANSKATNANADIWNWAVTLAFPDLGKKGNFAGIIVGDTS